MGEYTSKRGVSGSGNLLHISHKSKKIICILVVFFSITTVFSSIIPARDTRTLIGNIIGKNSAVQSGDSGTGAANAPTSNTKFSDLFKELSMLKREKTPIFSVVTKYNGTETTTRLKSFLPVAIDVNGDGKKDIRVWVFRLPGIDLSPPAACIKTTFLVRRLNDDIKYGPFEIYLQYTPKIISKLTGGTLDRIRIGYQTPAGAEVPDFCKLMHTYTPHIIYPRLKPMNKLSIDPGSIAGKANLNLLFSIADMNGDNVSLQHIFNINYNPAVKTEVSIGRPKKGSGFNLELSSSGESKATIFYTKEDGSSSVDVGLIIDKLSNFKFQLDLSLLSNGRSTIEYERLSSNPVNVTLFKKNSDNFYFYVNVLPKHITMSFLPESNGWMDINTYGESVNEIGFCDDLLHPSWKLYFADLPTLAKLNWNLSQKKSLEAGSLNVSGDTTASVHLFSPVNKFINTDLNAIVKLDAYAQDKIDMSISWDFKQRYVRLDQSKTDLKLSLSAYGENGNTFDASFILKNLDNGPYTIFFDDLSDAKADLSFIGKSFDVYDLDSNIYLQKAGNFTVKMGHLVKNKNGNLNISLYITKNGSHVNCNCTFAVTGGIEVYNLQIGYDDLWYNKSYIVVDENDTLYFQFGGTFDVFFNIANDLSWGYITIKGSIYVDVDFSFNSNGTHGIIKGKLHFKSNGEAFNISWVTVGGEKRFTLDGRCLVSLSDFHLCFGDIVNISIDQLAGSIYLENVSRDEGFFLFEFQGSGSLYLNSSFSSKNESDVICNVTLNMQLDTNDQTALLSMTWKEHNVTIFKFNIGEGAYLNINDFDFRLTVDGNKSLTLENLTAHISGYFDVIFTRSDDLSKGYIAIIGSISVDIDLSFDSNNTHVMIKGKMYFKPDSESFNISWVTIDGKKRFTLDGRGLVGLSDFCLCVGDIIDVSIDELSGSILLENASLEGGFLLFEFQGTGSLRINGSFSSKNESDIICNVTLDSQMDTNNVPATIAMTWKEHNVTIFKFNIGEGAYLNINDLDLQLTVDNNKSLVVENLTSHLSGYLCLSLNRSINDSFINMKNADILLHVDDYNNSGFGFDLGEINISADSIGTTNISFYNFTKQIFIPPYYIEVNLTWYNLTVILDASQGSLDLNELYIEHLMVKNYSSAVLLKNLSISEGSSKINIALSLNETEIAPRFINIRFDNSLGTNLLLKKFSFTLFLFDMPPVPTTLYSGKLTGGILDIRLRTFEVFSVEIANGSAIDHLDVNTIPFAGYNPDFKFNVSFDEPVNYLFFDANDGASQVSVPEGIYLNTYNITTKMNLSLIIPSSPDSKDVIGFRFDNVTLRADDFILLTPKLFLDPQNFSVGAISIEGYLEVKGKGDIWMFINDTWYSIDILGQGGSLAISPGHLRLKADGQITLDHTITLKMGLSVTIRGTFIADNGTFNIWWDRAKNWVKLEFDGSMTVENFLFKVEYNYNKNAPVLMPSNSQQTLSITWSTFHASGPAYLFIGLRSESRFFLHGSVSQINITNLNVNNKNNTIEINSTNLSGEFNFSTLPERPNTLVYLGLNVSLNGTFELSGITSNNHNTSKFDRIYFDGTGDIQFEYWEDAQSNITIYLESKNGFIGQSISIQLDSGRVFEIAHLTPGNANISSGFVNLSLNIDGDGNGMIFLDSSSITLDNARISYWKPRHFGWGIRLGVTGYFDADEWLLRWFPLRHTGHIYHGMLDIDITNGNQWYNLWPPFHPGEMNDEFVSLPYYNEYNLLKFKNLPSNS